MSKGWLGEGLGGGGVGQGVFNRSCAESAQHRMGSGGCKDSPTRVDLFHSSQMRPPHNKTQFLSLSFWPPMMINLVAPQSPLRSLQPGMSTSGGKPVFSPQCTISTTEEVVENNTCLRLDLDPCSKQTNKQTNGSDPTENSDAINMKMIRIKKESGATPTAMIGRRSTQKHRGDFSLKTRTDVWVHGQRNTYCSVIMTDGGVIFAHHAAEITEENPAGAKQTMTCGANLEKSSRNIENIAAVYPQMCWCIIFTATSPRILPLFMRLLPPAHPHYPSLWRKIRNKPGKTVQVSSYLGRIKFTECPFSVPDAVLASRNKKTPKWLQHPRERLPPVGGSRRGEEEEENEEEEQL